MVKSGRAEDPSLGRGEGGPLQLATSARPQDLTKSIKDIVK